MTVYAYVLQGSHQIGINGFPMKGIEFR